MNLPRLCPLPEIPLPEVTIKETPEDFVVEELALYEPCGAGTHTYFWMEKRRIDTLSAVRLLAAALGKSPRDAGVAGLKDAQAVSRQWISFEHIKDASRLAALEERGIRVLKTALHGNKLKMGHLRGNRFVIRLRLKAESPEARRIVRRRAEDSFKILAQGIPNYFGQQRFGRHGDNDLLGRMLVLGDREGFERLAAQSHGPNHRVNSKERNLLVNAFQSRLFNRVLALRMPEIGRILPGDLAFLHRNGAVFKVGDEADAAVQQARADAFEISPSGPIFGEKAPLPEGKPLEIEQAVLREAGVTPQDFSRREAESQPGARRALRIHFVEEPSASEDEDGTIVRLALPSGAYATVVLSELFPASLGTEL